MTAFLPANWLLWSLPLTTISFICLLLAISKLVRIIRRAELFSVPLIPQTLVEFTIAGTFQLHLVGPRFTYLRNLRFELIDTSNGCVLPVAPTILSMESSGMSEVRRLYGSVIIPQPGKYLLQVLGLKEAERYTRCRIIVTRPYTLYVIAYLLGIVCAGAGFVFGLIMSLLYLSRA